MKYARTHRAASRSDAGLLRRSSMQKLSASEGGAPRQRRGADLRQLIIVIRPAEKFIAM